MGVIRGDSIFGFQSVIVFGQTIFTVGSINYIITSDSTVEVAWRNTYKGDIVIPSSISYNSKVLLVTSIGNGAFQGRKEIISITIPSSILSIGHAAFYGCTGLTSISISIPSTVTSIGNGAFSGCSSLTSITIPSTVTSIGDRAFSGCKGLTSITIPSSVTSIGEAAFNRGIGSIEVHEGNDFYSSRDGVLYNKDFTTLIQCPISLSGEFTIPSSVISIGSYSFYGCNTITSITIPSSVTSIGSHAFSNCTGLTSISIPSSVTSIEVAAFMNCSKLTSITFSLSLTSIGISAFYGCTGLISITIPSSVTSIGSMAFYGCTGLIIVNSENSNYSSRDGVLYNKDFTTLIQCPISLSGEFSIPSTVTSIGNGAFGSCSGLTSITIPSTVTSIGNDAFSGCRGLTSITIPSSVTSISEFAFSGCRGLTSITIPSSVTSIGEAAFQGCTGLTSITIPPSVTSIGNNAFYNCTSLSSIISLITSPMNLNSAVFYGMDKSNCKLYVPIGTSSIYKVTSGWNDFSNVVELLDIGTSFNLNGIYYKIENYNTLQLMSISSITDLVIPSTVNYSEIDFKVTSIGDDAFSDNVSLSSVNIPSTVTSIGKRAFYGCLGLSTIKLPSSVNYIGKDAFCFTSGLIEVHEGNDFYSSRDGVLYNKDFTTLIQCPISLSGDFSIPSTVTSIGSYSFYGCNTITSITIPPSVTSIGLNAFLGCSNLVSLTYKAINCIINTPSTFSNFSSSLVNVNIGDSVKILPDYIFQNCTNITSIIIPTSVTSIGNSTFKGCIGITSVLIPPSVISIGNSSFSSCSGLVTVTIPPSVTSIGDFSFANCISLTSVHIPSAVSSIGKSAFSGSPSLIYVDSGNNSFSGINGVLYNKNFTRIIFCPISIQGSFSILPSIASIEESAFSGCQSLTKVIIPNSVTSIGDNAFNGCTGLSSIVSLITSPMNLDFSVFSGINKSYCQLHVPSTTKSIYKSTSGWNEFSNVVELLDIGANFIVDEIQYTINSVNYSNYDDTNKVTISGKSTYTKSEIPSSVNYMDFDYIVTSIGKSVFEYYPNFINLSLPNNIESIGEYTFNSCQNLNKIIFPTTIQSIGKYAFYNCTSLSEIIVNALNPPQLGTDVFYLVDKSKCILYIPKGSLDAYKSASQWQDFINIVELDISGITETKISKIKLYPNPASSFINISLESFVNKTNLLVYNTLGSLVLEKELVNKDNNLDISFLPNGIYILHLTDNNGAIRGIIRFIKNYL